MSNVVSLLLFGAFLFGPALVVGLAIGWFARGRKENAQTALALHEARRLHALVEQIRHDAYEHMTLDSRLAPIVVDTIRSSDLERQRRVAGSSATPLPYVAPPYPQQFPPRR